MNTINAGGPSPKDIKESTVVDPLTGRPGIPGGIVFLCAILTMVNPIGALLYSAATWGGLSRHIENSPDLMPPVLVATFAPLFVACFGIYAAHSLWKVRPKSVGLAKVYLFTAIVVNIIVPTMFILYLSSEQSAAITTSGAIGFALSIILNSPWFVYLSRSSRVSDAYGLK